MSRTSLPPAFFFFSSRRRHTRLVSDWSSDVCSSDLSRSRLFPQVQGNGDFSGGKEHNFQTKSNFLLLTADAAFQLDFFGGLRRATEASRAELLATENARQTVILTLVSDVASAYLALLQLDLQL